MRWLSNVHRSQHNFSFRSFTPFMMKILEDANEVVRDTAKEVVIELFKLSTSNNANSEMHQATQEQISRNSYRQITSESQRQIISSRHWGWKSI
jgi:hypothetical protein